MNYFPPFIALMIGLSLSFSGHAASPYAQYYDWAGPAFHNAPDSVDRSPGGYAFGDHFSNLEKYAMGLDAPAFEGAPFALRGGNGTVQMTFPWNPYGRDIQWHVLHTPDLRATSEWTALAGLPSTSTSTGEFAEVAIQLPTDGGDGLGFFRLALSITPPDRISDALEGGTSWRLFDWAVQTNAALTRRSTEGSTFFQHSVGFSWGVSAFCKDTGLTLQEGTYLISFDAGHDGNDSRPFATNLVFAGFYDAAATVTNARQVRDALTAMTNQSGVSATYLQHTAPRNGWEHWVLEFVVASNSPAIGTSVWFGLFAQSRETRNQALFDRLLIRGPALSEPGIARINVQRTPEQQMTYGMDFERLWHFGDGGVLIDYDELAHWAVGECRVDYVRVAINPAAELTESNFNWSAYNQQLDIMRALKRERPDLKFFASPRPLQNEQTDAPFTPYPLWVSIWDNPFESSRQFVRLDVQKGVDYYVRYLRFMETNGFSMTYLDAMNEATVQMRPDAIAAMMAGVRAEMGDAMPLVIAPSAHNWEEGAAWITEAEALGVPIFWDISASHNTAQRGALREFSERAKALDRPIWNTEIHEFIGPDDLAAANMKVIFEHVRGGYSGLNDWLSLGNEKKEHKMLRNVKGELVLMRIYYIFRHLVNTSGGGHYLPTDLPRDLTSSMAFINKDEDQITVWALNNTSNTVDTLIEIDTYSCQPTEIRWWDPSNGREGSVITNGLAGTSSLRYDVQGQSLYCFSFAITP